MSEFPAAREPRVGLTAEETRRNANSLLQADKPLSVKKIKNQHSSKVSNKKTQIETTCMEAIIGIVVGSIVLIIGALFGKWLNRDTIQKAVDMSFEKAVELMKEQAKFESAKDLQRYFTDIMYWLEYEATTDKVNIAPRLRRNPEGWEEAIKSFRVHLRGGEKAQFDVICETFYKKDGNTRYNYPTLDLDNNSANEVLDNIKAILKFAK